MEKFESGWAITYGDRWEDELCWDEALGVVASIVHGISPKYLRTTAEHIAMDSRHRNMAIARIGRP